jgi:ligand-binding SRPBCC domain-containing protein
MPVFDYRFTVPTNIKAVAAFHSSSLALRKLSPPPVVVKIHLAEPLQEGSRSEFTMWIGPLPIRWLAVHSQVHPLTGFTDRQERGPMLRWQHTHRFEALGEKQTLVHERIEYEHQPGWPGWLTRVLFSPLGLRGMFAYRAWVTRRECIRIANEES